MLPRILCYGLALSTMISLTSSDQEAAEQAAVAAAAGAAAAMSQKTQGSDGREIVAAPATPVTEASSTEALPTVMFDELSTMPVESTTSDESEADTTTQSQDHTTTQSQDHTTTQSQDRTTTESDDDTASESEDNSSTPNSNMTTTTSQPPIVGFNSTLFVDNLLKLVRKELRINATIDTILVPFEIRATDDDVTDTNFSANVFRGYFSGFDSVLRKDRCSQKNTQTNVTVQCLITFRGLRSVAYASVKNEDKALVTVSTSVEDVIFLVDFVGPHNQTAKLQQFKSVLNPAVKPTLVEGSVRSKWVNEFKSQLGTNVGVQLMKILYRDFRAVMSLVLSRTKLPG